MEPVYVVVRITTCSASDAELQFHDGPCEKLPGHKLSQYFLQNRQKYEELLQQEFSTDAHNNGSATEEKINGLHKRWVNYVFKQTDDEESEK